MLDPIRRVVPAKRSSASAPIETMAMSQPIFRVDLQTLATRPVSQPELRRSDECVESGVEGGWLLCSETRASCCHRSAPTFRCSLGRSVEPSPWLDRPSTILIASRRTQTRRLVVARMNQPAPFWMCHHGVSNIGHPLQRDAGLQKQLRWQHIARRCQRVEPTE